MRGARRRRGGGGRGVRNDGAARTRGGMGGRAGARRGAEHGAAWRAQARRGRRAGSGTRLGAAAAAGHKRCASERWHATDAAQADVGTRRDAEHRGQRALTKPCKCGHKGRRLHIAEKRRARRSAALTDAPTRCATGRTRQRAAENRTERREKSHSQDFILFPEKLDGIRRLRLFWRRYSSHSQDSIQFQVSRSRILLILSSDYRTWMKCIACDYFEQLQNLVAAFSRPLPPLNGI